MARKTDLRVIKTLKSLRASLGEMLTEMTFDDISVYDLCTRAEIRRATFYKHFNDKYAFLAYIVSYVQESIMKTVSSDCDASPPVEYISCYVKQVISYFNEREKIVSNVINSQAHTAVYNVIKSSTYRVIHEVLSKAVNNGFTVPTDVEFTADFINGGLAYLIVEHLRSKRITEDELIEKSSQMLNKILN